MDMEMHAKKFQEIIEKYNLTERADEIADCMTADDVSVISAQEFAQRFEMDIEDARTFLDFIVKGIQFRKKNLVHS
jgi:hypothetical protein